MEIKIGLLLIATGKYNGFVQPIIASADKYFFPDDKIEIHILSDSKHHAIFSDRINLFVHPIERLGFPGDTLYRYHRFVSISEHIRSKYLFYSDVDMRFVDVIDDRILPMDNQKFTVVKHPGFYNGGGSWESRPESKAFLPYAKRKYYFCGGFNGGETKAFLNMAKEISQDIDIDDSNNIVAEWHDESHLNRFMAYQEPKKLSPSYCFPENWQIPFDKKILALDKNHSEMRSL